MTQKHSVDWKRTMVSAAALLAAAVSPRPSLAEPHASADVKVDVDVDGRSDGSASRSVDAKVKAPDPKHAKATKHVTAPAAKASVEVKKKKVETDAHAKAEVKVDPKVHAKAAVHEKAHVDVEAPKVHAKAVVADKKVHRKVEIDEKAEANVHVDKKVHAKVEVEAPKVHAKLDPKLKIKAAKDVDVVAAPKRATLSVTHRVASRTASSKSSVRRLDVEPKPCHGAKITVDRGGLESEKLELTDCKGRPLGAAREHLSVLVRPWGSARPKIASHEGLPKADSRGEIAPGVRLLDSGLLTRLDAIGKHFPGKSFSFVSGYRPQSRGSNHQSGRAVDVRVVGVSNEQLVAFCRTLKDTGCGYYPNSSFVHVDVRNPGTGGVTWIDASGPGESPRYVSAWPPPKVHGTEAAGKEERLAPPANDEPHDDITSEQIPRLGEVPEHPLL